MGRRKIPAHSGYSKGFWFVLHEALNLLVVAFSGTVFNFPPQ